MITILSGLGYQISGPGFAGALLSIVTAAHWIHNADHPAQHLAAAGSLPPVQGRSRRPVPGRRARIDIGQIAHHRQTAT
ncbi:MAG: hypothetical protein HRU33_04295 [Rhodobacteraceae bacterium]|nr:hypothetical protein [Paracoccaceae bacterium]